MFQQLEGSLFLGPLPAEHGIFLYAFHKDGSDLVVAWCLEGEHQVDLGWKPVRMIDHPFGINSNMVGHHIRRDTDAALPGTLTQVLVGLFAPQVGGDDVIV